MSKVSINVLPMLISPFCHGILLVKMIEICFTSGLQSICMTVSVYVIYNKMNIKAIDMNINIIIFEIIFTVHTNIHGPLLYSLIWCQTVHMCVSPQSFLFGNGFKTKFA